MMKVLYIFQTFNLFLMASMSMSCYEPDNVGNGINVTEQTPIGSSKHRPGIGPNTGSLEGKDLQLPPCIKIVDRPNYRFNADINKLYGASNAFYVPISFVNTCCTGNIQVSLPPGMMIESDNNNTQNGLLIENVYFTVPPSYCDGKMDTTTIYLAVACLNENRTPPISRFTADYNIGDVGYKSFKVTNDPNLLKFLALLKDTPGITATKYVTNHPDEETGIPTSKIHSDIQEALWKITDGNGLSAEEIKKLMSKLQKFK